MATIVRPPEYSVIETASTTIEIDNFQNINNNKDSYFSPQANDLIQFRTRVYRQGYSGAESKYVHLHFQVSKFDADECLLQVTTSVLDQDNQKQLTKSMTFLIHFMLIILFFLRLSVSIL